MKNKFIGKIHIKALPIKLIGIFITIMLTCLLSYSGIGCVWKYLFGIPCPGCGMTTAVTAALRGDLSGMLRSHFMAPSLPLILLYILFDGHIFKHKFLDTAVLSVIAAGFMLHWIILLLQI